MWILYRQRYIEKRITAALQSPISLIEVSSLRVAFYALQSVKISGKFFLSLLLA